MSTADLTCAGAACVSEPPDRNHVPDIYLRDTETNGTRRITRNYLGGDPDGRSYQPAISGDGRFVAFVSEASNLTRGFRGRSAQVYVHDTVSGVIELVSRTPGGHAGTGASLQPAVSYDGSKVAFQSLARNLLCERKCQAGQADINLVWDVFVHDRSRSRTSRASADGGDEWMENSRGPSLDDAGCVLTFASRHPVNERDDAHDEDVFVSALPTESRQHGACGR